MQRIYKQGSMPTITAKWVENNSKAQWKDLPQDEKQALREELHKEQQGLCCYCCKKIHSNNKVSVEHLQDKHQNPNLQFEYDNLLLSCITDRQCNNAKKSKTIKIHPLHHDCDASIKMNVLSARLIGSKNKQEAEEAIEILKLNNNDLVNHRDKLVKMIESYLKMFNVCNDIYQLQKNSALKNQSLNIVKSYPQYHELEYILNKIA